jgi:hypothetical protein
MALTDPMMCEIGIYQELSRSLEDVYSSLALIETEVSSRQRRAVE